MYKQHKNIKKHDLHGILITFLYFLYSFNNSYILILMKLLNFSHPTVIDTESLLSYNKRTGGITRPDFRGQM